MFVIKVIKISNLLTDDSTLSVDHVPKLTHLLGGSLSLVSKASELLEAEVDGSSLCAVLIDDAYRFDFDKPSKSQSLFANASTTHGVCNEVIVVKSSTELWPG